MKAILIKGMEMPERCIDCPCNDDYYRCGATDSCFEEEAYEKRMDNCPLEETEVYE